MIDEPDPQNVAGIAANALPPTPISTFQGKPEGSPAILSRLDGFNASGPARGALQKSRGNRS